MSAILPAAQSSCTKSSRPAQFLEFVNRADAQRQPPHLGQVAQAETALVRVPTAAAQPLCVGRLAAGIPVVCCRLDVAGTRALMG